MEKHELVYVTFIRTTPEKLWAAITTPEFSRQYWGGNANVSDWKSGSQWQHVGAGEEHAVYVAGEVVESTPPKRLVLTWADPDEPEDISRVTFEIEPIDDIVRLTVVHNDFKPGSTMIGDVSRGWPCVLSSMKSYLETGKGLDVRAALKMTAPCA